MIRCLQRENLAAFALCFLDLLSERGHIGHTSAVDARYCGGTETDCGSGCIHRHVAAADDADALALEVRHAALADVAEQLHRGVYADCVFAGNANLLVVMRTDGDVNRVVLILNLSERNIAADGNAGVHLNAGGQDEVDIRIQLVLRQTIIRNAVAQHAAELGTLVIDYDLMTHQRQEIRR